MSDAEIRGSDGAKQRRLRRRAGEIVLLAPGDLVRVTGDRYSSWWCGAHVHRMPFCVEFITMVDERTWVARCLEHEVEARMLYPLGTRTYEFL